VRVRVGKDGKRAKGKGPDTKLVLFLFNPETGDFYDAGHEELETAMTKLYATVSVFDPSKTDGWTQHGASQDLRNDLESVLARFPRLIDRTRVIKSLQQLLTHVLVSDDVAVNAALAKLLLATLKTGALSSVTDVESMTKRFTGKSPDSLLNSIQELMMEFELDPFDDKQVEQTISKLLLPLIESDWKSEFYDPKSKHELAKPDYFINMQAHLIDLHSRVMALWDIGAIKKVTNDKIDWNAEMATRFRLITHPDAKPGPITMFFARLGPGVAEAKVEEVEAVSEAEAKLTPAERSQRATHLTFLGGAEGIGGSSVMASYQGGKGQPWTRVISDVGAYLDRENTPPSLRYIKEAIDAVFLTHTHIDHVGAAVYLHMRFKAQGQSVPFFITRDAFPLLDVTLHAMARDMQRARKRAEDAGLTQYDPDMAKPLFTFEEVQDFLKNVMPIDPVGKDADGVPIYPVLKVSKKMKVQFHHAGHSSGAASVIVMTPDGNSFLSGDIALNDLDPVPGFRKIDENFPPIHTAVWEATMGMRKFSGNVDQETRLIGAIVATLERGGKVLNHVVER